MRSTIIATALAKIFRAPLFYSIGKKCKWFNVDYSVQPFCAMDLKFLVVRKTELQRRRVNEMCLFLSVWYVHAFLWFSVLSNVKLQSGGWRDCSLRFDENKYDDCQLTSNK